jgi:branched-chain amino acid transport system substrate-binding protein
VNGPLRTLIGVVLAAILLAGCSSATPSANRVPGDELTVYFSGPLHGYSSRGAEAALRGGELALAAIHGRIGSYTIALKPLDDATPQSGGWDPNQATINARRAVQDPTTIGYIGEFNSGASAIAIPILNRAGIAQISPGSTAVGLTSASTGASPGEPAKYYPTRGRTFFRVVPNDAIEALALVRVQHQLGCRSAFVLQDGEFDGEDTALTFALTAQSAGLKVLGVQAFQRGASDYRSLAASVAEAGADCVLISAIDERSSALLTEQLAQRLPQATIFASSGLADSAYTDPDRGGLPVTSDPRVIVVSPMLEPALYPPAGRAFLAGYRRDFGAPEPPALFGYAAMKLMLEAIARATDNGRRQADRSKVVAALRAGDVVRSPLGSFRIDRDGDPSIRRYGVYRITAGNLAFMEDSG